MKTSSEDAKSKLWTTYSLLLEENQFSLFVLASIKFGVNWRNRRQENLLATVS